MSVYEHCVLWCVHLSTYIYTFSDVHDMHILQQI